MLYELPTNTQWCFDIQWCPRNPAVLSAASFDGRISVYSVMGGSADGLRQKQVDKVIGNITLFLLQHLKRMILLYNYFEHDFTDQRYQLLGKLCEKIYLV